MPPADEPNANVPSNRFERVHALGHVHLEDAMGSDLHIVNNARVSFDQESAEFTAKERGLLNFLMRERHGSPWEAVVYRFDIKAPIFVIREWQRHRVGCLIGETEITFVNSGGAISQRKTIDELWQSWTTGQVNGNRPPRVACTAADALLHLGRSQRNTSGRTGISRQAIARRAAGGSWERRDARRRVGNMRLRVMDESSREFTEGRIVDIVDSGVQPTFRVTLADGSSITMTRNHKVRTSTGWLPLEAAIGLEFDGSNAVMTRSCRMLKNGVPAYQDRAWMAAHRAAGHSVQEIADDAGCSYHTVRKWLKVHDLQFSRGERDFPKGHTPWNDGVTGYTLDYELSEAGRQAIVRSRSGERSNFWRGGTSTERQSIGRWTREQAKRVHASFDYTCQRCDTRSGRLHAHHAIPVWMDASRARDITNLVTVCETCHRAIHDTHESELEFARLAERSGWTVGPVPELTSSPRGTRLVAHPVDVIAVEYVGVQQTYDLSVSAPNHNFVANGMVVHNSFNEQSARYSEIPDEYYVPSDAYVRTQVGRPGAYSFEPIEDGAILGRTLATIETTQRDAFAAYRSMLEDGVAKEVARTVLPVGMYSRMKWTTNLRALFNFLSLRNHEHAQAEIRDFAAAVERLAAEVCPVAFEVFVENGRVTP